MATIAGTSLGLAAASVRGRDTTSESALTAAAPGELRLQDLFDGVLYAGPTVDTQEPPGTVYRREPEYEREIRHRIEILRVFYGVDMLVGGSRPACARRPLKDGSRGPVM